MDGGQVAPAVPRKQMDDIVKGRLLQMLLDGKSVKSIAKELGVSRNAIRHQKCKYEQFGSLDRPIGSGRKRKTTAADDRMIIREVKKNRFVTGPELKDLTGLHHVHERTIRRRISEDQEFNSYWATKKPFINDANRAKRKQWAQTFLGWTREQWHSVLWSDESPFVLIFNKKKKVWRRHNERYNKDCTVATTKHDKKINVWGCFSAKGVGKLHLVDGILEQTQYRRILEDHMLPSAEKIFGDEGWFFQQDNDPKHTAKLTKKWFDDNGVPVLEWASQSPDLNPIENLWSILDSATKNRRPANEIQLMQILTDAWNELPVDLLERLVDSMPRRCQAVIDANGYATKY